MLILGVHGGNKFEDEDDPAGFARHDSAAVLLRDGEVIAAIEEERLNRIKHSNCFPVRAIQYCLESAGCNLNDIDIIAVNISNFHMDVWGKQQVIEDPNDTVAPDGKAHFAFQFQQAFGIDIRNKIYFCHHHLAHAASAFAYSGFNESLVFTIDGDGDDASGMMLLGKNRELRKLREFTLQQSLGHVYQRLIKILGYDRFDEYKVMGLAPYGSPQVFRNIFNKCFALLPEGNYAIEPMGRMWHIFDEAGLVAQARRKGAPFVQWHKDFAAALQEMIETIVLHVLKYFREETKQRNLCLAGGVAHNCTLNGKVLYSGLFDRVFVQPAAHDAGGALGAAIWAWYEKSAGPRPAKLAHVYWGRHIGSEQAIEGALRRWSGFVSYTNEDNICTKAARILADGAVIGWTQGRSEFGPRALGNRSILADPRPSENKLRINEMIKKREAYRPFAPSVLEEKISDFFEIPPGQTDFPFMIFVLRVREHARKLLGAVTHVDGTARVQSVSRATNPEYWNLIHEFESLTGIPVLLNTSFNNNAEPIVDSVDEAIGCFLTTGINYLVVGKYLVAKKSSREIEQGLLSLAPQLPSSHKLVRSNKTGWKPGCGEVASVVESRKNRYFGPSFCPVSADMFGILQCANGASDLIRLIEQSKVPTDRVKHLLDEFMGLWSQRVIRICPP